MLQCYVDVTVNRLARPDGYWGNSQVRIPLPEELRRVEKTLRRFGLERYAEEFAESLNRVAEAAMPLAKPVLMATIRDMPLSARCLMCVATTMPPRSPKLPARTSGS